MTCFERCESHAGFVCLQPQLPDLIGEDAEEFLRDIIEEVRLAVIWMRSNAFYLFVSGVSFLRVGSKGIGIISRSEFYVVTFTFTFTYQPQNFHICKSPQDFLPSSLRIFTIHPPPFQGPPFDRIVHFLSKRFLVACTPFRLYLNCPWFIYWLFEGFSVQNMFLLVH